MNNDNNRENNTHIDPFLDRSSVANTNQTVGKDYSIYPFQNVQNIKEILSCSYNSDLKVIACGGLQTYENRDKDINNILILDVINKQINSIIINYTEEIKSSNQAYVSSVKFFKHDQNHFLISGGGNEQIIDICSLTNVKGKKILLMYESGSLSTCILR